MEKLRNLALVTVGALFSMESSLNREHSSEANSIGKVKKNGRRKKGKKDRSLKEKGFKWLRFSTSRFMPGGISSLPAE